jgi:hypothetical protein
MSLLATIPRSVKQAGRERACMTAISKGELIELTLAPLEGLHPIASKAFTREEYAKDAGACWQLVLEAFDLAPR